MKIEQIAKAYLIYQGFTGTEKQIKKLLNSMPESMLVKLCKDRNLIK